MGIGLGVGETAGVAGDGEGSKLSVTGLGECADVPCFAVPTLANLAAWRVLVVLLFVGAAAVVCAGAGAVAAGAGALAAGVGALAAGVGALVAAGAGALGAVVGVAASAMPPSPGFSAAEATLAFVCDPSFAARTIVHPASPAAATAKIKAKRPNRAPHFKERN